MARWFCQAKILLCFFEILVRGITETVYDPLRDVNDFTSLLESIIAFCRKKKKLKFNYRLTHSASELSGFTCTSSLVMNEKFQYRTRPTNALLKISSSLLVNE